MELAALDQFINLLLDNCSKYFDDLSGERSFPFGLLVWNLKLVIKILEQVYLYIKERNDFESNRHIYIQIMTGR